MVFFFYNFLNYIYPANITKEPFRVLSLYNDGENAARVVILNYILLLPVYLDALKDLA